MNQQDADDAAAAAWDDYVYSNQETEIKELQEHIKRLEKAGDDLESWLDRETPFTIRNNWREAKSYKQ